MLNCGQVHCCWDILELFLRIFKNKGKVGHLPTATRAALQLFKIIGTAMIQNIIYLFHDYKLRMFYHLISEYFMLHVDL
jgi:hypothetical protein